MLVASLSEVFTQDLEDIDLEEADNREYSEENDPAKKETITKKQAKRMFSLAGGNLELVKKTMIKYGYTASEDVRKDDYEKICKEIEKEAEKEKTPAAIVAGTKRRFCGSTAAKAKMIPPKALRRAKKPTVKPIVKPR